MLDVENGAINLRMRKLMELEMGWTRKESKASLKEVKRSARDFSLAMSRGGSEVDVSHTHWIIHPAPLG